MMRSLHLFAMMLHIESLYRTESVGCMCRTVSGQESDKKSYTGYPVSPEFAKYILDASIMGDAKRVKDAVSVDMFRAMDKGAMAYNPSDAYLNALEVTLPKKKSVA